MNDGAPGSLYAIDSSSLMDWQARHYPTDIFPTLVDRMDELVRAGRLLAPALVREEVEKVGTAGLTEETPASQKRNPRRTHFIPDVCRDLGVPCINLPGLMRREGWQF